MGFMGLIMAGNQTREHSGVGSGSGVRDESKTEPMERAHPEPLEDRCMGMTATDEYQIVPDQ